MTKMIPEAALDARARGRRDITFAALLFLAADLLLAAAPNRNLSDSKYTLLLADNLVVHGDFALERYRVDGPTRPYDASEGIDYRLVRARGHIRSRFPPGSALLSLPYVAVNRLLGGVPIACADGSYDEERELVLQGRLAALLMAGFCVLVFFLARLLLPAAASALVALVAIFGTPVLSTASRVLWQHTWEIVVLGLIVYELLRARARDRAPGGLWLGTLACWSYFIRPTNALTAAAVCLLLALDNRRALVAFLAVSALWLAAFAVYSLSLYGAVLTDYYRRTDFGPSSFLSGLAGSLVSPGRGLFVYVPILALVLYLVVRHWRHVSHPRLAQVALLVCLAHLLMIASFSAWWGGHNYGPRYFAGLIPWLALLAVLAFDAARAARASRPGPPHRLPWVAAGVLSLVSVAINTVGATSPKAASWNAHHPDVDDKQDRLWDWRHPPFLADVFPPR